MSYSGYPLEALQVILNALLDLVVLNLQLEILPRHHEGIVKLVSSQYCFIIKFVKTGPAQLRVLLKLQEKKTLTQTTTVEMNKRL